MKPMALETGILDHHKMIYILKKVLHLQKINPKLFTSTTIKSSIKNSFKWNLKKKLDEISSNSFDIFIEKFKTCLDKFAALKEKKVRINNSTFITKSLRKPIILRSQLKRKFNNNKSQENSKKYRQQRNYCVNFYVKRSWNVFKTWTLIRLMMIKYFGKP